MKVFEQKFYSYEDFLNDRKNKRSLEDIKNDMIIDAKSSLKRLLPSFDDKWIDKFEDQSSEKGIKYMFTIGNDIVHMYKNSQWLSWWDFYLNKKKVTEDDIREYFENKLLSKLEQFLKHIKGYDQYSFAIDNFKQFMGTEKNNKILINMFKELNINDKRKALAELKKIRLDLFDIFKKIN